jgi:hypothetical protein
MTEDLPEFARYEVKLACPAEDLSEVRAWVQMHPLLFTERFIPRQVNNVYLDSLAANDLGDHLDGVGQRQKLRFRWYGEDYRAAEGALELKCRSAALGWKMTCPVPHAFDLERITWAAWMEELRACVDNQGLAWLASVERPTLINAYQREYYESIEDGVRLTIDYNVRVYDQVMHASPNLTFPLPMEPTAIVEIKAGLAVWERLPNVLARFPVRAGRYSKYVTGMLAALSL